ncbi:hypothetical protein NW801_22110 [Brevibacillus laterosporus]|uniref:Uncharacterized protein n=1 Tax=Brevibacillus halotolerans TaxID=1507437 RepID=A0ABT4I301_9BACL|nr:MULTISPECIES: hypothetical protein [Brevibacillus]MCR8987688.1 hypothetical protein [Brevibacillus laterosporus]MCZ0833427.1 hypothetical protein [Brevibacillus halotolerans]
MNKKDKQEMALWNKKQLEWQKKVIREEMDNDVKQHAWLYVEKNREINIQRQKRKY